MRSGSRFCHDCGVCGGIEDKAAFSAAASVFFLGFGVDDVLYFLCEVVVFDADLF